MPTRNNNTAHGQDSPTLTGSATLAANDDHDTMNKTTNDRAGDAPNKLNENNNDIAKANITKKKKKTGFWSRLIGCFNPSGAFDEDKLDKASNDVGKPAKQDAAGLNGKRKSSKDAEADSKIPTEETAVSAAPSASLNGTGVGVGPRRPTVHAATASSRNSSVLNRNSQVIHPQLLIPNGPVVITAPNTPAYNTFDLDADPDVVIQPTPKGATALLPVDETEGVTSGAVQPPGGVAHPDKDLLGVSGATEKEESERGTVTDDDYQDAKEEDDIDAEEMRLIMNAGSGIPIVDGKPKPLLPPIAERHKGRKCLVLDMDETLLHSSFKLMPQHDFTVPVEIEWQWHNAYVLKRPGVEEFLRRMGEIYEVIIYTASVSKYADPVLDKVDVHKAVTHRLFRESCYNHRGNYVKDLSMLGRPLETCIILDNSPASYLFNPNNAVPVTTWFNDPLDTELTDLIGFLTDLAVVDDVRPLLARDC